MKKSIQSLVTKISQDANGDIKGGFGSIKGGISELPGTNESCTNGKPGGTGSCGGQNTGSCTNEVNCSNGSNSGSCSNNNTCFF